MSKESIENRIDRFNRIVKATTAIRKQNETQCIRGGKNTLSRYFNIYKRIGGDSKFGEAHVADIKGVPDSKLAMKIIPASIKTGVIDWSIKEVFKEIRILDKLGGLVEDYTSQNVPMTYDMFVCLDCKYVNPNLIKKRAPKTCAIVLNELANGDLNDWMKTKHTPEEWKSCIFQVLSGLTAVEEYMGMWHDDLHDGNMLYTNITKSGCWYYRFVTSQAVYDYYPPNTGQLWKLWDFGQSHILKKTRQNFKKMWEDIDKGIGEFMLYEVPANERKKGIKDNTLSDEDFYKVDEAIKYCAALMKGKRGPVNVPAFVVLKKMNWFRKPCGRILNIEPFTVYLKDY